MLEVIGEGAQGPGCFTKRCNFMKGQTTCSAAQMAELLFELKKKHPNVIPLDKFAKWVKITFIYNVHHIQVCVSG